MTMLLPSEKRQRSIILLLELLLMAVPATTLAQFGYVTPFAGTSTGTLISSITKIVNALLVLVALAATIVIIMSTVAALAGRDQEDIAKRAKAIIIYAVIGLIIVALSAAIINFILWNLRLMRIGDGPPVVL